MENLLDIQDLHAVAGEKEILKGLNLKINKGETHVIMGPNGAGKSTTANVILNNPEYKKVSGKVVFEGEDISDLSTDKIAKKGVFMSFQSPVEIPGISTTNFLKYAKNKITDKPVKIFELRDQIQKYMEELNMNPKLIERNLNVGFSGGEKKKNLEMRVDAENGATAGKFDLAKRAKAANLDAIHDTVHEMAKDEARHGKAFEGLLKRYFG